jgi:hypothetical protein
MTQPANDLLNDIGQFTGTENWYRTILPSVLYTDGAKYMADQCQAYWLLDDIAIYQTEPSVKKEEFQVWTLLTDLEKHSAVLTCEDGNKHVVFAKNLEMTTFPVEKMVLWYINQVILLPSEY